MNQSREFDVIVVGCGGAGLAAALAAQEQGARVCILERASKDEFGGNTRYTGAWMRMKSPAEVSDDFEEHFAVNAGGYLDPTVDRRDVARSRTAWSAAAKAGSFVDPNVVATLARKTPPRRWRGPRHSACSTSPLDVPFPTSVQPRISPNGGGLALLEALVPAFLDERRRRFATTRAAHGLLRGGATARSTACAAWRPATVRSKCRAAP